MEGRKEDFKGLKNFGGKKRMTLFLRLRKTYSLSPVQKLIRRKGLGFDGYMSRIASSRMKGKDGEEDDVRSSTEGMNREGTSKSIAV